MRRFTYFEISNGLLDCDDYHALSDVAHRVWFMAMSAAAARACQSVLASVVATATPSVSHDATENHAKVVAGALVELRDAGFIGLIEMDGDYEVRPFVHPLARAGGVA